MFLYLYKIYIKYKLSLSKIYKHYILTFILNSLYFVIFQI